MVLDGSSALLEEWTARVRAQWAGHRAAASAGGGDGGAWLDGDAAGAVACDAAMAPFVTGEVNPAALEDLVRLCVELDRLRHHPGTRPRRHRHRRRRRRRRWHRRRPGRARPGHRAGLGGPRAGGHRQGRRPALGSGRAGVVPAAPAARRPAGRAEPAAGHRLQRDHPGRASATRSPLRDRHCQWAGSCNQPASACEVHHVRHKKDGGKTSTRECVLLCWFHHQVMHPPAGAGPWS